MMEDGLDSNCRSFTFVGQNHFHFQNWRAPLIRSRSCISNLIPEGLMYLRLAMREVQHICRWQHVTMLKGWKFLFYIMTMVPMASWKWIGSGLRCEVTVTSLDPCFYAVIHASTTSEIVYLLHTLMFLCIPETTVNFTSTSGIPSGSGTTQTFVQSQTSPTITVPTTSDSASTSEITWKPSLPSVNVSDYSTNNISSEMTPTTEPYAYTSSSTAPVTIKVSELGPKWQLMPHFLSQHSYQPMRFGSSWNEHGICTLCIARKTRQEEDKEETVQSSEKSGLCFGFCIWGRFSEILLVLWFFRGSIYFWEYLDLSPVCWGGLS